MTAPSLEFTILGCGSSGGVPRIDGEWGACDPANPLNRRRRCALLVRRHGPDGVTTVVVDTGPDLREQLIAARVTHVDAVLYTHAHADHLHGIDDLRGLALRNRRRVDVYMDAATAERAHEGFGYCFHTPHGSFYPPILTDHRIHAGDRIAVDGAGGPIEATAFRQHHGEIDALGFRFGGLAYSSDLNDLPAESLPLLEGLEVWVVDALRYASHGSHFTVAQALEWIGRLKPRRAILTNLHFDLDYATLAAQLPPGVEPAYDGLVVEAGAANLHPGPHKAADALGAHGEPA